MHLLTSGEPLNHLWECIPGVGSAPTLLGKVDVKPLKHLRVIVVSCAKVLDWLNVMIEGMEFRNVQVFANECVNES